MPIQTGNPKENILPVDFSQPFSATFSVLRKEVVLY
jgi:hypothetical protein